MTRMKIYSLGRFICLSALCVALSSCAGEEIMPENAGFVTTIVEAVSPEGCKTVLVGKDVLWTESDTLTCFCYTESPSSWSIQGDVVPTSIDGRYARFEITTPSGLRPRILVNPESDEYTMRSDGSVVIPLETLYHLKNGQVPQESMISVGEIVNGKVEMRNVLTYMKFTIESDFITKIRVKSNDGTPISGNLYFNPQTLQTEVEGDDNFYVYPDGADVFTPGIYYVPVPAVHCPNGLNVKFYKADGNAARKSLDSEYTIARNRFIDMGKESDWQLSFMPATKTVSLVFYYPEGCVFPFSDKPDAASPMSTPPTWQQLAGNGRKGPYYPVGYPGVEVYFYLAPLDGKTKSYFISQGGYGMRYGVWTGDYMTIPAIKDYRLTTMSLEYGTKTAFYAVTSDPETGAPETFTEFSGKDKVVTKTFSSSQTKPGVSCRLSVTKDDYPTSIRNVTYTYEIVD